MPPSLNRNGTRQVILHLLRCDINRQNRHLLGSYCSSLENGRGRHNQGLGHRPGLRSAPVRVKAAGRSSVAALPKNGAASCTQLAVLRRADPRQRTAIWSGPTLRRGKPRLHFGRSARGPVIRGKNELQNFGQRQRNRCFWP
jgi:hypothetical protein